MTPGKPHEIRVTQAERGERERRTASIVRPSSGGRRRAALESTAAAKGGAAAPARSLLLALHGLDSLHELLARRLLSDLGEPLRASRVERARKLGGQRLEQRGGRAHQLLLRRQFRDRDDA